MIFETWAPLVSATATTFTGLLFARAAWHKLADFTAFTGFVADYELVKPKHVHLAALGLIAAEVAVVISMLLPGLHWLGAATAMGLLWLYAAGMAININLGRDRIECGCGGAVQPLSWSLVRRNGVLAAIAALGLLASPSSLSLGEAGAAIGGGFTLWVGYLLADQIMATTATMRLRR